MRSLKITSVFGIAVLFMLAAAGEATATSFVIPPDGQLAVESRAIVRGRIVSLGCGLDESSGHVYTYVKVALREVYKGNIADQTIILKQFGGNLGGKGSVIFGAPGFSLNERVILFLDTAKDGVLRVHDEFLGKYTIERDASTGKLMVVRGAPLGESLAIPSDGSADHTERMELRPYLKKLRVILTASMEESLRYEQAYFSGVPLLSTPPEYNGKLAKGEVAPQFHLFNPPARWFQPDTRQSVTYLLNPDQAPSGAQADVDAAMTAWSGVSGCSLRVADGGSTSSCTSAGFGVVEFDNCLGFFSGGGTCQSILAEGGFDYGSASEVVNGTSFFQISSSFVSFNPFAVCSFSQPCNVEEVCTHEMGHSLGLAHSWDPSYGGSPTPVEQAATMYYIAHFDGRCATVESDDIAGITFVYPASSSAQYQGFLDAAGCDTIEGWVWDANNPGTTVSVDIFDGSTLIGTAPAGLYREDLLNVLASPNHGFSFLTPASLKDGAAHSVTVKVHGTSMALTGGPRSVHCATPGNLQGALDGVGCDAISGWAWDASDPFGVVNVDLYDGSNLFATVTATLYRQDLQNVYGSPYHGFTFPAPASVKDGLSHTITAKFGGTSTSLTWNNPQSFACSTSGHNFQGAVDPLNCTSVTGYAWDTDNDRCTIDVAIYLDGVFRVVVPAQQSRSGVGNGYHGFSFAVPTSWKDGTQHSILVRFSGTSTALANSPASFTCP